MRALILCVLVIASVTRADYPSTIPKCKNGDSPCLVNVANEILQKYYAGLPELNLLSFDPLHAKKIVLERNPSSPVNIDISFFDSNGYGLKDLQISTFTGLNADLSGRTVFGGKIPELRLNGHYKINGRVLILPIVGEGLFEIRLKNVDFQFSTDLKPIEKNNQIYATLEHVKLEMKPENVHFQFDNLFNGDKTLGDNMNLFVNENWTDIFEEIKPSFTKALGRVVKAFINNFFEKYPYSEYFE